jgi:threonine dehydrogenase-like Zn-dependent dehydrogenase
VGATVVLVGRSRHAASLAKARNAGIDVVVDAETEDLDAIVHGLTGGRGAHSVFECSGATSVAESSLPLLRRGGRLVLVAFFQTAPAFDVDRLIHHELEIVGSRGKRPSSYRTALALMASGAVRVEPLISARLPLESWADGLDRVARGEKVVFDVAP